MKFIDNSLIVFFLKFILILICMKYGSLFGLFYSATTDSGTLIVEPLFWVDNGSFLELINVYSRRFS